MGWGTDLALKNLKKIADLVHSMATETIVLAQIMALQCRERNK